MASDLCTQSYYFNLTGSGVAAIIAAVLWFGVALSVYWYLPKLKRSGGEASCEETARAEPVAAATHEKEVPLVPVADPMQAPVAEETITRTTTLSKFEIVWCERETSPGTSITSCVRQNWLTAKKTC